MGEQIRLVVTCSDRKRVTPPDRLRARNLGLGNAAGRGRRWVARLATTSATAMPAATLYKGEHWSVASSLIQTAGDAGLSAELWVVSAGYGLVAAQAVLKPYSATFTTSHPDCVTGGANGFAVRAARRAWWSAIASWRGPQDGAPRTLRDLAARSPNDRIVVAAGAAYTDALLDDLMSAQQALASRNLLLIVSAGTEPAGVLSENILPLDASMQSLVGGTRLSLNVRLLAWLLRTSHEHQFQLDSVRRQVRDVPRTRPDMAERRRLSDDEVMTFIQRRRRDDAQATKSQLLHDLRASGSACEQGRFSGLFRLAVRS